MNRIILIGNGFDLAHGMPTSYRDFLDDFWKRKFEQVNDERKSDYSFSKQFENDFFIVSKIRPESIDVSSYHDVQRLSSSNEIELSFKNIFLQKISEKSYLQNWVDIENEYYELLKKAINEKADYSIKDLNRDFEQVKKLLEDYLFGVKDEFDKIVRDVNSTIEYQVSNHIYSKIDWKNFSEKALNRKALAESKRLATLIQNRHLEPPSQNEKDITLLDGYRYMNDVQQLRKLLTRDIADAYFDLTPENTLFLNFNYTYIEQFYTDQKKFIRTLGEQVKTNVETIKIHGSLVKRDKNPIIFGYGDELDDDYKRIENLNDNKYLENIKSIKYLETDNYRKLLEFIESDEYQVFIFGHSCGTSDRTLLNTLFEHDNCASIKPFYHKKEDGSDNYSDIVRNISRNFNSKVKFRDRVVNKTFCQPLVD